jgi:hypothetical protein
MTEPTLAKPRLHLPLEPNPVLVEHARERADSIQNRIADRITLFAGSVAFVYIHIVWFGCWIGLGVEHYPYGLLTMIVSLEAIFLSTFVMISQNRADAKRQVVADQQWATIKEGGPAEQRAAGAVEPDPGTHQGHPRRGEHARDWGVRLSQVLLATAPSAVPTAPMTARGARAVAAYTRLMDADRARRLLSAERARIERALAGLGDAAPCAS